MSLLPILSNMGLFFTQPYLIVPLAAAGFLLLDKRLYSRAALLVTFTTIYNAFLKSLWQIPLPPPLKGWAFPSGHMHSAMIFWGYLASEYRNPWFTLAVTIMLSLSGFGLIDHGYHYLIDIIGAIAFGAFTLATHAFSQQKSFFRDKPYREGALLTALGSALVWLMPEIARRLHVWQALAVVVSFTLGWALQEGYQQYKARAAKPVTKSDKTAEEEAITKPTEKHLTQLASCLQVEKEPVHSVHQQTSPQRKTPREPLISHYSLRRRLGKKEAPAQPSVNKKNQHPKKKMHPH